MIKTGIITIGDELLLGQVINTNATWLGQQLFNNGFEVAKAITIQDNKDEIIKALNEFANIYPVTIITGGLGPTNDDITKKVLSQYFDKPLVFSEEAYSLIEKVLEKRHASMNELNKQQAMLPQGIKLVENYNGTAWGMIFDYTHKDYGNTHYIVSLPGVPFEMKPMFEKAVLPFLKEKFQSPVFVHKTAIIEGIPESELAIQLEKWENNLPSSIKLAYLPQAGIVRLRLSMQGENKTEIEKELNLQINKLQKIVKNNFVGIEEAPLEKMVGDLLRKTEKTVSTAESCTGGYVAHLITSIPGSSDYFIGSVVSYANEVKMNELGVSRDVLGKYGAVSQPVVEQMAKGVKTKLKTDYSIAVSGIAGPSGGTSDKPVGTVWIAVASPTGIISKKYVFGYDRLRNIRNSAMQGLIMLYNELKKQV